MSKNIKTLSLSDKKEDDNEIDWSRYEWLGNFGRWNTGYPGGPIGILNESIVRRLETPNAAHSYFISEARDGIQIVYRIPREDDEQ